MPRRDLLLRRGPDRVLARMLPETDQALRDDAAAVTRRAELRSGH